MHTRQVAGVIVCYRRAWAVISGLAALSSFSVQSCAFLYLWPLKSMWSHWELVNLGRSASGTHHTEIILDWLPWSVISHLLTQWGFMMMTTEIHSFVYGFCPCCGYQAHPTFLRLFSPFPINLLPETTAVLMSYLYPILCWERKPGEKKPLF